MGALGNDRQEAALLGIGLAGSKCGAGVPARDSQGEQTPKGSSREQFSNGSALGRSQEQQVRCLESPRRRPDSDPTDRWATPGTDSPQSGDDAGTLGGHAAYGMNFPITHITEAVSLPRAPVLEHGMQAPWYREGRTVLCRALGSRLLPHGLAHEQPGLALIPEVTHRNEIRQSLILEGAAPEREGPPAHGGGRRCWPMPGLGARPAGLQPARTLSDRNTGQSPKQAS